MGQSRQDLFRRALECMESRTTENGGLGKLLRRAKQCARKKGLELLRGNRKEKKKKKDIPCDE